MEAHAHLRYYAGPEVVAIAADGVNDGAIQAVEAAQHRQLLRRALQLWVRCHWQAEQRLTRGKPVPLAPPLLRRIHTSKCALCSAYGAGNARTCRQMVDTIPQTLEGKQWVRRKHSQSSSIGLGRLPSGSMSV